MSVLTEPMTTVEALLRMARAYRWVREHGGQNRGEVVEHILRLVGLAPGDPWCAAFVAMVGRDMFGDDWPLPLVGGCATLHEAALAKGLCYPYPAPGAVFLLWSQHEGRMHHTGFVDAPCEDGWTTVEGNSNEDHSTNGIGVFAEIRDFGTLDRFIYWWAPVRHTG